MEGFSTLHRMALDTLSIPAMATECERVFSSAKKLVSPHRCCIKEDLVEASVPESVVGLRDYYAELGRDKGGSELLHPSLVSLQYTRFGPPGPSTSIFPNLEAQQLWL